MWRLLFAIAMLSTGLPLFAGEPEKSVTAHLPASPLGAGTLLEALAGLLFVVLLILGLGWLIRRYGSSSLAGKGDIKILSAVSLGPRERAVLMEVGSTRLLVGVAPGRVQTLHIIEGNEEQREASQERSEIFSKQLDKELQGGTQ